MFNIPNIPLFNGVGSYLAAPAIASVGGGGGPADLIIASLQSLGATVTGTQQTAINTFVTAGQSQSWYSKLLRLYLPIWGSKAPCELDWITRTSGTYVGAVTHAAGYTTGGTARYFNTGVSPAGAGMTLTSSGIGILRRNTGGTYPCGVLQNPFYFGLVAFSGMRFDHTNQAGGRVDFGSETAVGIISGNLNGLSQRGRIRTSAGIIADVTRTITSVTSLPTVNIYFNGANNNGALLTDNAQTGAMFLTSGMTDAEDANFTLALKNLWETCTGLTLA